MSEQKQKAARGRPKKIDAGKVREIALHAYENYGPFDVSINTICELASVSKPSLYREFGSEDGLAFAVLELYAEEVLRDIFAILTSNLGLTETLKTLTVFVTEDARVEHGCVFHKMLADKRKLGPKTKAKVEEINIATQREFRHFLRESYVFRNRNTAINVEDGARYLAAQLAWALAQRALGEDPVNIAKTLEIAFSVFEIKDNGNVL